MKRLRRVEAEKQRVEDIRRRQQVSMLPVNHDVGVVVDFCKGVTIIHVIVC